MADQIAIPTKEEIATLPCIARVAFAARCARRVEPLFGHYRPSVTTEDLKEIASVITCAERAPHTTPDDNTEEAISLVRLVEAASFCEAISEYDADALQAASDVADAAVGAARAAEGPAAAAFVADVVANAVAAPSHLYSSNTRQAGVVGRAIRRDYELLRFATEQFDWTDDTPVPPEFFGPLWPDGVPEGWPQEATRFGADDPSDLVWPFEEASGQAHAIKLEFAVPDGMDDAESQRFNQDVVTVLEALSALDASMGGTGLRILDDASQDTVDSDANEPTDVHNRPFAGVGP